MKYQYLKYNLKLSERLKTGYITLVGSSGKKYNHKALFVPGYGWVPCSMKLCANFTNDPKHLVLVISEDDDIHKPTTSDIWVARTGIIRRYGIEQNQTNHNVKSQMTKTTITPPNIKVYNRMSARALVISENAILQFLESPKMDKNGSIIQEISFVCGNKKGIVSPAAISIINSGTIDDFQYAEVSIDGKTPLPCIFRNHKKQ